MTMTSSGSLRPDNPQGFSQQEEALLLAACPGISVSARQSDATHHDVIWGEFEAMHYAWAGDSTVRFKAATGGVLTALGVHLLKTKQIDFLLHVHPDPQNPGLTVIDTKNGEHFERTYQELWDSEASWDLETRCKVCPDALGETADIAAADVWPGGGPTGEDEGFNGIVVRTSIGQALIDSSVASCDLVRGDAISPQQFSEFQPHQVSKKTALQAWFDGMRDAGVQPILTQDLRVEQLALQPSPETTTREREGSKQRFLP